MNQPILFIKSYSTQLLLIAYILFVVLFSVLLFMDSKILKEQIDVIDSSEQSTIKMRTIADLIEIARKRVNLSHAMVSSDDIFEKDEISQEISELGGQFIKHNMALADLNLTKQEQALLKKQSQRYPVVRQNLRIVVEFAFENTEISKEKARSIILYEVVPLQQIIIDSFINILSNIQEQLLLSRKTALLKYSESREKRKILIVAMFFASLILITWIIIRISSIEQKLHSLSMIDSLTGIANRRSFDKKIALEWKIALRESNPLSVLLIDIDYFKKYNDFYGHQKGDQCLTKIALIMKNISCRANDLTARYGGEEFAVIMPNTDQDGALNIAHRLIKKINKANIAHKMSDIDDNLTVSIGIATFLASKDSDYEQLIKAADEGLYLAKKNGRNQAALYHTVIN